MRAVRCSVLGVLLLAALAGCVPELATSTAQCSPSLCADNFVYAVGNTATTSELGLFGMGFDPGTGGLVLQPGYPLLLNNSGGSVFDMVLTSTGVLIYAEIGGTNGIYTYAGGGSSPFVSVENVPLGSGIGRPRLNADGTKVYVPTTGSPSGVWGFNIQPDGSLVGIGGMLPYSALTPDAFVFGPDGTVAYASSSGNINGVAVDIAGAMTDLGTMATASNPIVDMAIDPLGQYIVTLETDGSIELWTFSTASDIAFADKQTPTQCFGPGAVIFDRPGRFVYATCSTQHAYGLAYLVDRGTSTLVPVAASTAGQVPLFDGRLPVSFPGGTYVFNAQLFDNTLQVYRENTSTGVLTALPGPDLSATLGYLLGGVVTP